MLQDKDGKTRGVDWVRNEVNHALRAHTPQAVSILIGKATVIGGKQKTASPLASWTSYLPTSS